MPRPQTWIGHDVLVRLLNLAAGRPELNELAMIFLASYAFLLRVPSECLPMAAHEAPCNSEVPVFCIRGGEAVLRLPFRKNRLFPTEVIRSCWCKSCKSTCPVHVFGAFMRGLPAGARPFALFDLGQTLLALRELLCELDIDHAMLHRLHDFRRGHAEDLRRLPGTYIHSSLISRQQGSASAYPRSQGFCFPIKECFTVNGSFPCIQRQRVGCHGPGVGLGSPTYCFRCFPNMGPRSPKNVPRPGSPAPNHQILKPRISRSKGNPWRS